MARTLARTRVRTPSADRQMLSECREHEPGSPIRGVPQYVAEPIFCELANSADGMMTIHDLKALVNHGVLPAELLEPFAGQAIHRKVAADLADLAALVHEHRAAIEGRSLLTFEAVDEAAAFGVQILWVLGEREAAEAEFARARSHRNKADTLVIRTYEDVRSAMAYLRREQGDADAFAPSLFVGGRTPRCGRPSGEDHSG